MTFEFSLIGIQACLIASLYPFCRLLQNKRIEIVITILFVFISIFLQSRTLFLIVISFYLLSEPHISKRIRKKAYIVIAFVTVIILILININSFIGRIFIWKNIVDNIYKIPWNGFGTGMFKYKYGIWQSEYFIKNQKWDQFHLVADAPQYAFNEVLHFYVEFGIIVIFIFGLITYFNIRIICKNKKVLMQVLASSNLSILIFSLFSYPLHSIWILIILFSNHILIVTIYLKRVTLGIIITFLILLFTLAKFYIEVKWKKIWLYGMSLPINANQEKKELLASCLSYFYDNPYFLGNYTSYLLSENNTNEALEICKQNEIYYNQYQYNLLTADALLQEMNLDSAKNYFIKAHNIIPNRFIPLNALFNISKFSKDSINAKQYAEIIINMPVKVPSSIINKIKNDAELFLNK